MVQRLELDSEGYKNKLVEIKETPWLQLEFFYFTQKIEMSIKIFIGWLICQNITVFRRRNFYLFSQ